MNDLTDNAIAIKILEMVGATEESPKVVKAIQLGIAALKTVEGQKPPTNSAMDAISLCKELHGAIHEAGYLNIEFDSEWREKMDAVVAQLHQ